MLEGEVFNKFRLTTEISKVDLHSPFFDNCGLGTEKSDNRRICVSQVRIKKAKQRACFLRGIDFQDVSIDGLGQVGRIPLFVKGCLFEHTVLAGRMTMIKFNWYPDPAAAASAVNSDFNRRALEFYNNIDWAIDISQAKFTASMSLEIIPGHLVRRDEATQALIRRTKITSVDWESLPWNGSSLNIVIQWWLDLSIFDSTVLIASKNSNGFTRDLDAIQMLRARGLAT